jgi:hypothetical protein
MSFRKYGGTNYSAKHNYVSSNTNISSGLYVTDGIGQYNSYVNAYSDISSNYIGTFTGPTGPGQGGGGGTGYTGPAGANGTGGTGYTGPQGYTGPRGASGSDGINGTSYTGPKGNSGEQGNTGDQGSTGPQGNTGEQGNTGPQGATGSQGATGYTPKYVATATGLLQMSTLPLGVPFTISDISPNISNLDYQVGQYVQYSSSQYPSSYFLIGLITDITDSSINQIYCTVHYTYFIDSSSFDNWNLNISGPAGSNGATGFTGPIGPQGYTGSKGNDGTSYTGSQGSQGPPGLQGKTGPQGAHGDSYWIGVPNITGVTGPYSNSSSVGNTGIYYDASIEVNGYVWADSFYATSDYRIKENVVSLNNTFIVDELNPVTYRNIKTGEKDIGLIAHEIQEIYPYLVNGQKDSNELQSINYTGLIPILIKEIKDLKKRIEKIESNIKDV